MDERAMRSRLLRRFGAFYRSDLQPLGFVRKGFSACRDLDDVRQGVSLQLDKRGPLRYTFNIYWHLLVTPHSRADDWGSMDGSWRLGILAGGLDRWFTAFQSATFEDQFAEAAQLIVQHGLPLLKRYESVRSIVAAVDDGTLTRIRAFGPDPGWQHWKFAYCAAYLGDHDRALVELRELYAMPTAEARFPDKDLLEALERGDRPRIVPAVDPAGRRWYAPPVKKAATPRPAPSRRVIVRKKPRS